MSERAVSVSEMRDRFAEYLEDVESGRVLVTKHGQGRAYLVSVRELRAMEETLEVLENDDLMRSVARGVADLKAGRVQDAREAFAELDVEFSGEE